MYIDKNTAQGEMFNKVYELTEDIKPLCCETILKKETRVKVERYTSKNRLLIEVLGVSGRPLHKIKRSNLNRVGKEIS
jgi:Mg2+ and Co2+ transporter CorA